MGIARATIEEFKTNPNVKGAALSALAAFVATFLVGTVLSIVPLLGPLLSIAVSIAGFVAFINCGVYATKNTNCDGLLPWFQPLTQLEPETGATVATNIVVGIVCNTIMLVATALALGAGLVAKDHFFVVATPLILLSMLFFVPFTFATTLAARGGDVFGSIRQSWSFVLENKADTIKVLLLNLVVLIVTLLTFVGTPLSTVFFFVSTSKLVESKENEFSF